MIRNARTSVFMPKAETTVPPTNGRPDPTLPNTAPPLDLLAISGDGGDNALTGTAGGETIEGLGGDDTINGRGGNDILDGGTGIDTVSYADALSGTVVRLNLGTATDGEGGTDSLTGFENATGSSFNDILVGNGVSNVLTGGTGYDQILGLGGDDFLFGGTGAANEMYGGLGSDTYVVSATGDTIVELADQGYDSVETTNSSFTLAANLESLRYTGAGNFTGTGNALDNLIFGGAGNDVLIGRGGNDTFFGEGGSDTVSYIGAAGAVTADLETSIAIDGDGGEDGFQSISNLFGSQFGDTLTGNSMANILDGYQGDDTLVGGAGNDSLRGGAGTDTASYASSASGVFVNLSGGIAVGVDSGIDSIVSIERVVGTSFADDIFGTGGNEELDGGSGRDVLLGLGGNDILRGGRGAANELYGGAGDDTYYVDAADTIVEGIGGGTDLVISGLAFHQLATNVENLTYGGIQNFAGIGNALANVITSSSGNDTLTGHGGDDTLSGGAGIDTIQLSGLASEYFIITGAAGVIIQDTVDGRDGRDTVFQAERVRFSDGSIVAISSIEPGGGGGPSVPVETQKDGGAAQVLPGLSDDDFLPLAKDADLPLVLPGVEDLFGSLDRAAMDLSPWTQWLMPSVDQDGTLGHSPDAFLAVWDRSGWNHDSWSH